MPKFQQFRMPDAGEGLTEADIVTWRVAVGDTVEVNQPLVEIETAKSLVELPCPFDGVVTKILVPEGATAAVGDAIIEVDVDPFGPEEPVVESPAASEVSPEPAQAGAAASELSPEPAQASPSGLERLSSDTSDAALGSDSNIADDPASTPPAAAASASGAVLVGYGVSVAAAQRRARKAVHDAGPDAGEVFSDGAPPVLAKPPVRKLAAEMGVDLTTVSPSGPGGIVTREDVLSRAKGSEPRRLATYKGDNEPWLEQGRVTDDGRATRVPVKSVRKRTAEAVVSSAFTAPHVTVFHTVDVSATMELVAKLKTDREFADVRVTPLLVVAKALLIATRRHPEVNASWDDESQEIVYKHYVNLGIAASTPRGLVVPNIKDAHRLTLLQLAKELQELTQEARAGKLTPQAMSDGTITITNVGALGIDTGTPILNPGEAAILAFGAIRQMPWVHEGQIQIRWVTELALSFDHRLVDGELGARLLADVASVMNDPGRGLIWG